MNFGTEYRWVLEGYTPETIPMSRLGEYMQCLAKMLGQEKSVHFERVERGSVAVVSNVAGIDAGKVSARMSALRSGKPPADLARTYETLNGMVAADGATALLRQNNIVVLRFPGKKLDQPPALQVPDSGSVVGYLYMLSDGGKAFHARIRLESGGTLMCTVSGDIAKKLRDHLFETVKISGRGIWERSPAGVWAVNSLEISEVVKADSATLRQMVDRLRQLEIDWPDDPLGYLDDLNQEGGTLQ